jgi:ketopantoate hydroxymethyltransferase
VKLKPCPFCGSSNRSSIRISNEELLREAAAMIKYILTDGYKYEGGQEILDKIETIVGKTP